MLFSEVYSAYFNAVAAILTEALQGGITEKRIIQIVNEKAFSEHIKKTLDAAKGCFLEFSYRDVYSLQKDIYRGKKVYETIMNCIDKYWEG